MSNYTKITDFEAKDSLPSGDSGKIIRGTEFEVEFDNISTAIATKADQAGPTFTGTASFADVSITNDLTVDTNTLHVDSTNNRVGVGTTTPLVTFQANLAANSNLGFNDAGVIPTVLAFNDGGARIPMGLEAQSFKFTASSTDALNINTVGNVGIGTTDPLTPLWVQSTSLQKATFANDDYVNGSVGATFDVSFGATSGTTYTSLRALTNGRSSWTDLVLQAGGGNVGIGTTTPTALLHTLGGTATANSVAQSLDLQHGGSGAAGYECEIRMGRPTTANRRAVIRAVGTGSNFTAPELAFDTNEVERLRINSSGDVRIGSAGSVQPLLRRSTATGGLEIDSTAASGGPLIVKDNGAERLRIDTSGNVGIGTSSPAANLEVKGTHTSGDKDYAIIWNEQGAGVNDLTSLAFRHGGGQRTSRISSTLESSTKTSLVFSTDNAGVSEKMRIDSSGNVGIGTSSPATKLHLDTGAAGYGLTLGALSQTGITYQMGIDSSSNFGIYDSDAASQRLTIAPSGNVGIGTDSPSYKLDLQDASSAIVNVQRTGATASALLMAAASGETQILSRQAPGVFGAVPLTFEVGGSERVRIDSSGNLLVGSTSADTDLGGNQLLRSATSGDSFVVSRRTGTLSNSEQAGVYARANDGAARRSASIIAFKHAGITNACGALNMQQENAVQSYLWSDNSANVRVSSASSSIGTTSGTVVGTQTSDERLKDIEPTFEYGLDTVMALKPIAYTRTDQEEPVRRLGFGAQTTRAIVPETVYDTGECLDGYDADPENPMEQTPKSDDTKLAMEYVQLVPVLVKAIQDLKAKVEALENA